MQGFKATAAVLSSDLKNTEAPIMVQWSEFILTGQGADHQTAAEKIDKLINNSLIIENNNQVRKSEE